MIIRRPPVLKRMRKEGFVKDFVTAVFPQEAG